MFTKPLEKLTCTDIREFCEQRKPEGKHLDYKLDIPAEEKDALAKTVAAFANTQGGYLILGVNDNRTDVPVPPFVGMKFREGIPNQIAQIVHKRVQPVPYVITHVCQEEGGHTFAVVYVPQSTYGPHYIINHKSIYVRTGESSTPEDLIHPEALPWLFNSREKSTRLRKELIDSARNRFRNQFPDDNGQIFTSGLVVPLYPDRSLFPFFEARKLMGRIEDREGYTNMTHRSIPGGMVFADEFEGLAVETTFSQIHEYGMFCFHHSHKAPTINEPNAVESFRLLFDFCRLLFIARNLQKELNMFAPIMLRFEVTNLAKKGIKHVGGYSEGKAVLSMLDNSVSLTITLPGALLVDSFFDVLMLGLRRLMWMLGKDSTSKEALVSRLLQGAVLPNELKSTDAEQRLLRAYDSELPLAEFEFSTAVAPYRENAQAPSCSHE